MPPWAWGGSKVRPSSCLSYGQDFSEELSSELIKHWEYKLLPAYWSCLSTRKHQEDYKQVANQVFKAKAFSASVFWRKLISPLFLVYSLLLFTILSLYSSFLAYSVLLCTATETSHPFLWVIQRARWLHAGFPEFQRKTQIQIYPLLSCKFHSFKSYLSPQWLDTACCGCNKQCGATVCWPPRARGLTAGIPREIHLIGTSAHAFVSFYPNFCNNYYTALTALGVFVWNLIGLFVLQ